MDCCPSETTQPLIVTIFTRNPDRVTAYNCMSCHTEVGTPYIFFCYNRNGCRQARGRVTIFLACDTQRNTSEDTVRIGSISWQTLISIEKGQYLRQKLGEMRAVEYHAFLIRPKKKAQRETTAHARYNKRFTEFKPMS